MHQSVKIGLKSLATMFSRRDDSSSVGNNDSKGRCIVQDSRERVYLMLPFILWIGAMVGVYTSTEEMMVTLPSLLSELNGIKLTLYGVDRAAFLANVRPQFLMLFKPQFCVSFCRVFLLGV